MKKADLLDWVKLHGCEITPLTEYKSKTLQITNPANDDSCAYIYLPIDGWIKDFLVFKICSKLGITIPTHAAGMKDVDEIIEKDHKKNKNRPSR